MVAAELFPLLVGRIGDIGAVVEILEAGNGGRIVAPGVSGEADVIEMKAVDVVFFNQFHGDIDEVLLDAGVAGIQLVIGPVILVSGVVLGEPIRVAIEGVVGALGRDVARAPNRISDDPRVDFDRRILGVGAFDEVGEGVKIGRESGVLDSRLEVAEIEGIAAAADLGDEGVEAAGFGIRDEAIDSGGRFEIVAPSLDPETANFGGGGVGGAGRDGGG